MEAKKLLVVFGTRPEAIKMAPLILRLKKEDCFKTVVCVTAQHRELLDDVLKTFKIAPEYDLNLMRNGQSLSDITRGILKSMDKVMEREKPNMVLVHGDTTTTFTASLAAFYNKIPVGHVEAGLRTGNPHSPYPEEMNRRLTGAIAALHFAPTSGNMENLVNDGINPKNIYITGNTVIDALLMTPKKEECSSGSRWILLTCHRRENWGRSMKNIFGAVRDIADEFPDVNIVYPVHPNPVIRKLANDSFVGCQQVHLLGPLDYQNFCSWIKSCYLVLTDSGGLQEEAPALGKPVLVLREETERPEAVRAGTVRLVGTNRKTIYLETKKLLTNKREYERMAKVANPYGNGTASEQIVAALKERLFN